MFKVNVFCYFLCSIYLVCNADKNEIIENIVEKLNAIKTNDVYYINENMFFIKNSNLSNLITNKSDISYISDYNFTYNDTHDKPLENGSIIYNISEVNNLTTLFYITSDVFRSHSLIFKINEEVNLKVSSSNDTENELDHDFEADILLEKNVKESGRGAQIGFLPIMYILGVITTMLKVLTFLTLKGLTIGTVLLTVAYTYSIKYKHHGHHHGHHGHHAHYSAPTAIIKTSSHSFPHRYHSHVPKYHSHYSSYPHLHHHPHIHYPHKKHHYSDHHPEIHHPEQIEIVKNIHVHSKKPHKHIVPETHSFEYVKDSPIIEYPHKHHPIELHSVKKRFPHSQPIIEYANSNDNHYPKTPKKIHSPKSYEQPGIQSLYDIQKDYSKYAANEDEYSPDSYKQDEFNPVNHEKDAPAYGNNVGSYAGDYVGSAGSYVGPPAGYVGNIAAYGGNLAGYAEGYGGNPTGYVRNPDGYSSNSASSHYAANAESYAGNSGGYAENSGGYVENSGIYENSAGYAHTSGGNSGNSPGYTRNAVSYIGGNIESSYGTNSAGPPQSDKKSQYTAAFFTNQKDYNMNSNSEEYSSNEFDNGKPHPVDGAASYSTQYHNRYPSNQQNEYPGPVADPNYNSDSSYDNSNRYDQSSNEIKQQYSASSKISPVTRPEKTYKSKSNSFLVNIPSLPEDDTNFVQKPNEKEVTSQPDAYQDAVEPPAFESQKTNTYESSMSSPFGEEISAYNDQQQERFSSGNQDNFDHINQDTSNFNSETKDENVGSSNIESRESLTKSDDKIMQELEFEPAWAYILFNNQNNLQNNTSTPSNDLDLDVETSHQMPVIKCC